MVHLKSHITVDTGRHIMDNPLSEPMLTNSRALFNVECPHHLDLTSAYKLQV